MRRRKQRHDTFSADRLMREIARDLRTECDGHVDRPIAERRSHAGVPHLFRQKLDLRPLGSKGLSEHRERFKATTPAEPNAEAAQLARAGTLRRCERSLRLGERAPGPGKECSASVCQRDLSTRAPEELCTELCLELPDRDAERRLRHLKLSGGTAEVELLGNGNEVPKVAQLGHSLSASSHSILNRSGSRRKRCLPDPRRFGTTVGYVRKEPR